MNRNVCMKGEKAELMDPDKIMDGLAKELSST